MGCFISHSDNDEEEVSQKKRKVVMVGLQNSGKTSILNFLIHNKFIVVAPTAGFNVENLIYENEKYIFFDVGGKVRSLWTCYYENLDGLIFVIDSNDKQQMYTIKDELVKLNKDLEFYTVSNQSNQQYLLALLFYLNKSDLPEMADAQQLIEELGIYTIIDQDVIIQKCSAKTGEGIWEGIQKLHSFSTHKQKNKEMPFGSNILTSNQNTKKERL